jgi:hypothetical protein
MSLLLTTITQLSAFNISDYYSSNKTNVLVFLVIFSFLIMMFIYKARRGQKLFVRRIAGLEAVDEAVGRATEMGKPILYVPGLSGLDDVATIASINILSKVAERTAEYQTRLIVPCRDPLVMTITQEVVKTTYLNKGRPDAFDPNSVFFVTDNQFGYVAAVDGLMVREKPATNFYMGMFWAESLLLAETGNSTGAIQIAGTDAANQLPFFIVSCDYTLMGEELYAASAYLSREPLLLGSLKGQDYGKFILMMLIVAGVICATLEATIGPNIFCGFIKLFQIR